MVLKEISHQSSEIAKAVLKGELNANDQGIVFGYATNETKEFMPLPIMLSHKLMKRYEEFRREFKSYFADAKCQVSVEYEDEIPTRVDTVVFSCSHSKEVLHMQIENDIKNNVINPVLLENSKNIDDIKLIINPSGKFTIWGSFGDSGCVGRKIIVDTYGGVGRVGGGCFSSKNATKVDRSGAYFARYMAKNIVANKLADRCEIELSYAIGISKPISLTINTFGTEKISIEDIYKIVNKNFDFTIKGMIDTLDLLKPIYKNTACYGHFGRDEFPWERIIKLSF